jgi:hypothetical protein
MRLSKWSHQMMNLSRHAQIRAQQRGVTERLIEMIFEHADVEKNVGDDCTLIRVSRRQADTIRGSDKLSKFALIWSETRSQIVTVLPLQKTAAGRRYRSNH